MPYLWAWLCLINSQNPGECRLEIIRLAGRGFEEETHLYEERAVYD